MRQGIGPHPFVLALAVLTLTGAGSAIAASACTCRYAGQSYDLGTCVCMQMPDGARTACCGQVLNNTSWTFIHEGCDVAARPSVSSSTGRFAATGGMASANGVAAARSAADAGE